MKKKRTTISSAKIITISLSIILIGIIAYFAVCFLIANILTQPGSDKLVDSPVFIAPKVEDVSFSTPDGLTLNGWFFKNSGNKIIIMVSGFAINRANAGYFAPFIMHDLYQKGYSILTFDPREISRQGTRDDFGQDRGNDVLGAVQFAQTQGFERPHIGIIADSLGAVSTLMVVEKLQGIGPIVLDSAAARMQPLIELRMSLDKHLPSFLFPGIFLMAKLVYHIDIAKINPIEHVAMVPDRIFMFVVDEKDSYIPPDNSQELLQAANPQSKLVTFTQGDHVDTYRTDPALYRSTVYTFIDNYFAHE